MIKPNTAEEQRAVGEWVRQHVLQNLCELMEHLQKNPGDYEDEIMALLSQERVTEGQYRIVRDSDGDIDYYAIDSDGDIDEGSPDGTLDSADIAQMEAELDFDDAEGVIAWLFEHELIPPHSERYDGLGWEFLLADGEESVTSQPIQYRLDRNWDESGNVIRASVSVRDTRRPLDAPGQDEILWQCNAAEAKRLSTAYNPDDPQEVIDYLTAEGTLPKDSTGIGEDDDPERETDEVYEHWLVDDHWAYHFTCEKVFGLTIWPRTCTGQAILLDGDVVMKFRELHPHLYEDAEAALAAHT